MPNLVVDVYLDDDDRPRRFVHEQPFPGAAGGASQRIEVDAFDFSAPVDVAVPPVDLVDDLSDLNLMLRWSRLRCQRTGYNLRMRFRLGFTLGFGTGYCLGARAGRARYEQIKRLATRARTSDAYEVATDKARTLVEDSVERAKDLVDDHSDADGREPEIVVTLDVADAAPGPPPAGSLSDDRPTPPPSL